MSTQATAIARQEGHTQLAAPPTWPARYARFGEFHVDLLRQEIYRDGKRAKVQSKIYQALLVLIARPGDIITREEVCRGLWPEALNVNLDANVNTTINKLRLVLNDSPENPVFIETIPRRGYSFIASVQFSDELILAKPLANGNTASGVTPAPAIPRKDWWLAFLNFQPTALRLASFVLVGMLMGALLVLAWRVASNKKQRSESLGRQSVSLLARTDHNL